MSGKAYHCPVEATVDVAGGKWKPIIIYQLLGGAKRFGELRRIVGGVSQRSLTLQLRQLELDGIVHREVFAEVPPRVEYSLTEWGYTLRPVLKVMKEWGDLFIERSLTASEKRPRKGGLRTTALGRPKSYGRGQSVSVVK